MLRSLIGIPHRAVSVRLLDAAVLLGVVWVVAQTISDTPRSGSLDDITLRNPKA